MAMPASSGVSPLGISADVFEHLAHSERLLTAKELARLLAVSPKTLYSYVSRNLIPYYKIESNVRFAAGTSQNGSDSAPRDAQDGDNSIMVRSEDPLPN